MKGNKFKHGYCAQGKGGRSSDFDEAYTKHTVSKIKQAKKQKEFRQVERALQNKDWKSFDNELYT